MAQQETFKREQPQEEVAATFAETRLATCGIPTLNSMSVRIERQRAKGMNCPPHLNSQKGWKALRREEIEAQIRAAVRRAYGSQELNLKAFELVQLDTPLIFSTLLLQLARTIQSVNVSCNSLRELDEAFVRAFPEMEILNCKENILVHLPFQALRDLRFLRVLNVSGNQLDNLSIDLPQAVAVFDAGRNRLRNVDYLHTLTNLVTLDLSHNSFELLPCGLVALTKLQSLTVDSNRLVTLATRPELRKQALDRRGWKATREVSEEEKQRARQEWRVEWDPSTNERVYFHSPSKRVTRVTPTCFQVQVPKLLLSTNQGPRTRSTLLQTFPLGWEIIVPSLSDPSTTLQFVNHCTRERFATIPEPLDHWEKLNHLHVLVLSNNHLFDLPPSIGKLKQLKRLEVNNNKLLTLPNELQGLEALETLHLSMNKLTRLPPSFSKLVHLTDVDLKFNRLCELPATFGNLQHLRMLDVRANILKELPSSFLALKRLETINLSENPALMKAGFPSEVLQAKDLAQFRWQLEEMLAIEKHQGVPPQPQARVIGIGAQCWSTDLHLNRELTRAIEVAKETHTLSLHWRGIEPTELPRIFFTMFDLQELRLSGQNLNVLPAEFEVFAKLRILELRENQICTIESRVFGSKSTQLSLGMGTTLEKLDFRYNRLNNLPETLDNCVKLQVLRVSHNVLDSLPKVMNGLSHTLVDLQLAHNQFLSSPPAISALKALERLDLSFNRLATLEMDFSHLSRLQVLHLSGNRLSELPLSLSVPPIRDLSIAGNHFATFPPVVTLLGTTLKRLDMQTNRLERLPINFGSALATLTHLESDGNPLRLPPAQVMRLGMKVIQRYLEKRQERVDEIVALLDAMGLYYDRTTFDRSVVQHLLPPQSSLPFLTSDHLTAFDCAVDTYVNGPFYLPPSFGNRRSFRRGVDLCHEMVLLTHFQLAQSHHRTVLTELLQLLTLLRQKRWADKTELRYDLQRPWGRRGELVDVFTVRQSLLFPKDDCEDRDAFPSIFQVIETRTQRGFPPEPFVAHQRTFQDVANALTEFVGPYGPIGIVHENVPLRCACNELLQYGKMHDPCRQRGFTIVSVLYSEDESERREVDDQMVREAQKDLLSNIRTFLETREGQEHFFDEVKRIKDTLRVQVKTLQKQLARYRTTVKLLVQRMQKQSSKSATLTDRNATIAKLEMAKARIQDMQMELVEKQDLSKGILPFDATSSTRCLRKQALRHDNKLFGRNATRRLAWGGVVHGMGGMDGRSSDTN